MSEKRFEVIFYGDVINCVRDETGKEYNLHELIDILMNQQATIKKQEEIIKSQDMEISRQYNLCLAMSGVLREEFGVYDVFDRSKDKRVK